MYDGDLGFVDEYGGEIDDPTKGGELAKLIGEHPVTLLANHGVIVTAPTIVEAVVPGRQLRPPVPPRLPRAAGAARPGTMPV